MGTNLSGALSSVTKLIISLVVSLDGSWTTNFNSSSGMGALKVQMEAIAQRIKENREGDGQRKRLFADQDKPQSSKRHVEKNMAEKQQN